MNTSKAGFLGDCYEGWQQYADAFLRACRDSGVKSVGIKPSHGYLRIDARGLPEHLVVLADAVERATDGISQVCGATNPVEHVERAWVLKLCHSCQASRRP